MALLDFNSGRKSAGWKALLAAKVENLELHAALAASLAVNQVASAPPPPSVAEPKSGEEDSEDSDDEDAGSDDGDKVHLGWEDEGYD
jgi:hypothetical protein